MPLQKLILRPGLNREGTNYSNEGGWYDGDKIRFRSGNPEKIGGWTTLDAEGTSTASYLGTARSLWNWIDFGGSNYLGIGTNLKYYIEQGGAYSDVTPIRVTYTSPVTNNCFTTTVGSKVVVVTITANGATNNDFVTFSGAVAVGGVPATDLNKEFQLTYITSSTFSILVDTAATSTATGGGTGITAAFQVTTGLSNAIIGIGWGAGPYDQFVPKTLTNPFTATATGISVLTVTQTAHGLTTDDYVYFDSIATDPCGINKDVLEKAFKVTVTGLNTYTISTIIGGLTYTTTSTAASGGTVIIDMPATIPARTWGSPYLSGGGIAEQLTLWSADNYGQDLIMAPRGSSIYYWKDATGTSVRASLLSTIANATTALTTTATFASGVTTITVALSTGIAAGALITGTGITAGTYVSYSYLGGNSVPIAGTTTAISSGNYTFSYSGVYIPFATNQIMASALQRFVIAFGANPYIPGTPLSTFDPMLVRWSDQGVPYDWVPTFINQSGEFRLTHGSYIVAAQIARVENLVWTDSCLYSMQYLGPPYVYKFDVLMDNISIISPNAAVSVNNITYWMGFDKFYMYNGTVSTLPCSLKQYVFEDLNSSQGYQIFAGGNSGYNEVWWFYCSEDTNLIDRYVIYNYLDNVWYSGNMTRTAWVDSGIRPYPMAANYIPLCGFTGSITGNILTVTTIYYGTIAVGDIITGSMVGTNTAIMLQLTGDTGEAGTYEVKYPQSVPTTSMLVSNLATGHILYHEATVDDNAAPQTVPIVSYVQSSDFDIEDGQNFGFVWRMLPDVNFNGSNVNNPYVTMTIKPRQNSGAPYGTADTPVVTSADNFARPYPPNSSVYVVQEFTGQVYTRLRGRQMSFRIDSDAIGVAWQLGNPRYDVRPDGRR